MKLIAPSDRTDMENNETEKAIAARAAEHTVILRPSAKFATLNLRDIWQSRELIYFLTWRDLKVRYKQTILGASWAILKPFLSMVVFSIFFGGLAKMPSDNIPYPIFSYAALLPWTLFSGGLSDAAKSLVSNSNMITKIYFPRAILPLSAVLGNIVDFFIAFVVLLLMMLFYHIAPTTAVWTLPLFLIQALVASLGVGLWLAAMDVLYRDVNYVVGFLTQLWMFITPVVYSSSLVSSKWQVVYALNPMTGVVDGFRWALLGTAAPDASTFIVSACVSIIFLITGMFYFRHMEHQFADMV
jgi:lipopolysaccharide transport system permease protein